VHLSILAVFVVLTTPAVAVKLFRYRGAAKDGGTLALKPENRILPTP
jgi:hypothetical protein